jgi:hypothetical protein
VLSLTASFSARRKCGSSLSWGAFSSMRHNRRPSVCPHSGRFASHSQSTESPAWTWFLNSNAKRWAALTADSAIAGAGLDLQSPEFSGTIHSAAPTSVRDSPGRGIKRSRGLCAPRITSGHWQLARGRGNFPRSVAAIDGGRNPALAFAPGSGRGQERRQGGRSAALVPHRQCEPHGNERPAGIGFWGACVAISQWAQLSRDKIVVALSRRYRSR